MLVGTACRKGVDNRCIMYLNNTNFDYIIKVYTNFIGSPSLPPPLLPGQCGLFNVVFRFFEHVFLTICDVSGFVDVASVAVVTPMISAVVAGVVAGVV